MGKVAESICADQTTVRLSVRRLRAECEPHGRVDILHTPLLRPGRAER